MSAISGIAKLRSAVKNRTPIFCVFFAVVLATLASGLWSRAAAQATETVAVYLLVSINGVTTDLIGEFSLSSNSDLATTRSELSALGILVPDGAPDEVISLNDIPNLIYSYNEPLQSIDISVPDAQRVPTIFSARSGSNVTNLPTQAERGLFFNYNAFVSGSYNSKLDRSAIDFAALNLDGTLFSEYGAFSQTGIFQYSNIGTSELVRLDSTWSYFDAVSANAYQAGDFITGGLAWTRPIRMAGFKFARNFTIRPDLITIPLPTISGSAAVPSTLDVYVGNARAYTTQVPAGPFRIDNLPIITGSRTANIVLTDISGRQTETQAAIFSDPRLLRAGLVDYSIQAGFARSEFGRGLGKYDNNLLSVGSIRYGLNDKITLEGHFEQGHGVTLVGSGIHFPLATLGIFSAAASASRKSGESGASLYANIFFPLGAVSLQATTQRTFDNYFDLASIPVVGTLEDPSLFRSPKRLDQISVSASLGRNAPTASFSFLNIEKFSSERTRVYSGTLTQNFSNGMSLFVNGFLHREEVQTLGAIFGLSIPLGGNSNVIAGVTSNDQGTSLGVQAQKSIGTTPGDKGGRVSLDYGRDTRFSAYGALLQRTGLLEGTAFHWKGVTNLSMSYSGALVLANNAIFSSARIDDAFAIVDVGYPDVGVSLQNRDVGRTNEQGQLLVTGLHAYQDNLVTIDSADLPLNVDVETNRIRVVPSFRSGVLVGLNTTSIANSGIIILVHPDGTLLEPGGRGTHLATGEAFFVGYDGRVFIRELRSQNTVRIETPDLQCESSFDFTPRPLSQVVIGPVVCRPSGLEE